MAEDTSGIQQLISRRGQAFDRLHERTFTRWLNYKLAGEEGGSFENLSSAFFDGVRLIRLVEMMSGKQAPRYHRNIGKKAFLGLENINMALNMMEAEGIKSNVTAREIQEGNMKAVLSVLWWLTHHYQIQRPFIEGGPLYSSLGKEAAEPGKERMGGRLLSWLQMKTQGYPNVQVKDLHASWFDGMALLALIHQYDPSLLVNNQGQQISDFEELDPSQRRENLSLAFDLAEKNLGIPRLFEPDEVLSSNSSEVPNEECFMIYLSFFPNAFLDKEQGRTPSTTTTTRGREGVSDTEQMLGRQSGVTSIHPTPVSLPHQGADLSGLGSATRGQPFQAPPPPPPPPPPPAPLLEEQQQVSKEGLLQSGYPSIVPNTAAEDAAEAIRRKEAIETRESQRVEGGEPARGVRAGARLAAEGRGVEGGLSPQQVTGETTTKGKKKKKLGEGKKKKEQPTLAPKGLTGQQEEGGLTKKKKLGKKPLLGKKETTAAPSEKPAFATAELGKGEGKKKGLKPGLGKKVVGGIKGKKKMAKPEGQVSEQPTTPTTTEVEGVAAPQEVIGEATVFEIDRIPDIADIHRQRLEEKREMKRRKKLEREVMERTDITAPEDRLREGGQLETTQQPQQLQQPLSRAEEIPTTTTGGVSEGVVGEATVFEIDRIPDISEIHKQRLEEKREMKRRKKLEKEVLQRTDITAPEDKLRESGQQQPTVTAQQQETLPTVTGPIGEATVFEIDRIPDISEIHQRRHDEVREMKRRKQLEREVMERTDITAPEDRLREQEGGESFALGEARRKEQEMRLGHLPPEKKKVQQLMEERQREEEARLRAEQMTAEIEADTHRIKMEAMQAERESRAIAAEIQGIKRSSVGPISTTTTTTTLPTTTRATPTGGVPLHQAQLAVDSELKKIAYLREYLRQLHEDIGKAEAVGGGGMRLEEEQRRTSEDIRAALQAKKMAKMERRRARQEAAIAERERLLAEETRIRAEREKVRAEMERLRAEEEKALAEQQVIALTLERLRAEEARAKSLPITTTPTTLPTTTTTTLGEGKGKEKVWREVERLPPTVTKVTTTTTKVLSTPTSTTASGKLEDISEREARKAQGIREQHGTI